ncbi:MAG: cybB [Gammaproteobacteria bacterium]|jgi:cytochrome b561|nr:cybB [Gammaproteobacteria bacterium]
MQIKNTTDRYGLVTKLFHGVVALSVMGMLLIGSLLDILAGPTQGAVYGWHKSLGITLLALMIVFMLWSARNIKPRYPQDEPVVQVILAKVVRYLLYGVVTAMCLSGWIFTTAKDNPPVFWGWFNLPAPFVPVSPSFGHTIRQWHTYLAWTILGLVILHVIGALYHHFVRKDNVLKRML